MTALPMEPPALCQLAILPRRPLVLAPEPASFEGEEYQDAPDVAALAAALLREYPDDLTVISHLVVRYLWRAKGGAAKTRPTYAQAAFPTGLLAFAWPDVGCVVWLAADHLQGKSTGRIAAELFGALLSVGWDGVKAKYVIRGPDVAAYVEQLRHFGAWQPELANARRALLEADPTPGEDTDGR